MYFSIYGPHASRQSVTKMYNSRYRESCLHVFVWERGRERERERERERGSLAYIGAYRVEQMRVNCSVCVHTV